jgi:hypothetical protein
MLETSSTNKPLETNASTGGRLSSTIITYISISAIGGLVTIFLMLFGDFEGKVSRVISTLVLFGLFTACSSYHMGKSKTAERSPLLAQVGNIYMLLLGLVLIWGTLAVDNYQDLTLLPMTFCIIGLVQLGIVVTEYIARFLTAPQPQLVMSAFLTAAGMVATTFLFTLPLGLNDLTTFGEGYWKFAIAVILFTGIMLSITGFIIWAFRSQEPAQKQNVVSPTVPVESFQETEVPQVASNPVSASPAKVTNPYVENGVPQFAPPVSAPMAWPVFPNGQPLPAKSNGRPDFTALQTVANIYAESERQFFG